MGLLIGWIKENEFIFVMISFAYVSLFLLFYGALNPGYKAAGCVLLEASLICFIARYLEGPEPKSYMKVGGKVYESRLFGWKEIK